MPAKALAPLLAALADIEYRLACGAADSLNLGALVGAFVNARAATGAPMRAGAPDDDGPDSMAD